MASLCLVSIFKNESHILEEWIEHYLKQGVDRIFLTDNGSTDQYMHILEKYISERKVSLNINDTKHAQIEHLNHFFDEIKTYDWVIVCDLDEFIYARNGFGKIKDYISQLEENVHQVHIPWKLFGSNGHIQQPSLVIPNFLTRMHCPDVRTINCKCITRTRAIVRIYQHDCHTTSYQSNFFESDGSLLQTHHNSFSNISEDILKNCYLHLNHYAIQSWEWFRDVKMTRGDVLSQCHDSTRNEDYFRGYDHNGQFDDELRNLSMQ
jgi:glycosyltransferase involved in cell wall biosynthesis